MPAGRPGDPGTTPGRTGRRPRLTLRRRLVAGVLGLVLLVAAATGAVSTLALRDSLLAQVDTRAVAAAERAVRATERAPDPAAPRAGQDGAGGARGDADRPDGAGSGRRDPRPLTGPGQDVGTVSLVVTDGRTDGAYLTQDGVVPLDDAQVAVLSDLPADGTPRSVTLDDLGSHRAVALRSDAGDLVVTALPVADVEATVTHYVTVELLVLAGALVVAGVGGSLLVRHELRPLTRLAATATRVSELPLGRGEVRLPERVDPRDTDPSTEVGQVGAALDRLLGHVERSLAEREESEQQVRRFVADASHELRTPLASIRGYTELVRRSPEELPAGARAALDRVEAESVRMSALVDDLLLLARLDAGRPLEHAPVDVAALAVDAVADAHAAGPDHVWRLDLPDDVDLTVLGDDHRLRQVLANLTSNARRHTPGGTHVVVGVRREGDDVLLAVTDDGPGIPPELRDRLFQRFTRGDASRNRAAGSTGLGLAIAHAVVAAHGGTVTCASEPGRTTFLVRLPADVPTTSAARPQSP